MLADRCLSVLSVSLSATLVYCGQTVGCIKMPLGTEVGLGPGDIVIDLDPATPARKGAQQPPLLAHVYSGQRSPISATDELLYIRTELSTCIVFM